MFYPIDPTVMSRSRAKKALLVVVAAGAVSILGGCTLQRLWEPSREDVLKRILPSSVQVLVEQQEGRRVRTGSGVAIGVGPSSGKDACFVLTSGHTVSGQADRRQVFVVFGRHRGKYEKAPATVVAHRDAGGVDLALLRADGGHCEPAVAGIRPNLGTPVWVVGFPWGRHMTLTSGIVSQVDAERGSDQEDASRLMVDAAVSYGISGGPVFEARSGQLVGVVEGYSTARVTSQGSAGAWYIDVPVPGQTFVTPLGDIRKFLTDSGLDRLLNGSTGLAGDLSIPRTPQP
jgi:S1-C subfamily serine protease